MAGEDTTIARPYAEAVFARAVETDSLDQWSEMLEFLVTMMADEEIVRLTKDPKMDRRRLQAMLLAIGEGHLHDEAANLMTLLLANKRLDVLPEIARLYEGRKQEHKGALQIQIISAYSVDPAQQKELADALRHRFGRDILLIAENDPDLIGGIKIRAGDLVIDYSLQGQLRRLTSELGI